ncbi:hypothetical protein MBANPS3_008105 [Mucor bainieri]
MEILETYISSITTNEIAISSFVKAKYKNLVDYLVSEADDTKEIQKTDVQELLGRMFKSYKKKNGSTSLKMIMDYHNVQWEKILDDAERARLRESEARLERIAIKRRKFHLDLHIKENESVQSLLTGASSSTALNEPDDVFSTGPAFDLLTIKNEIKMWRHTSHRIEQLSKQDLLFYGIVDLTNKSAKSAIKGILKDNYSTFKNHMNKYHVFPVTQDCSINLTKLTELMEDQFKDETNIFTDSTVNERHYIACFIYPLMQIIVYDISRQTLSQRWGEAKLLCGKEEVNRALDVEERRCSGSNIDAIFGLKKLNDMEFCLLEVTGGTVGNHHEHYLEDKNKLGKNLKVMLKSILSLRTDVNAFASSIKLYGLQFYLQRGYQSTKNHNLDNEIYVYSMHCPINNMYMFQEEKTVKIPTLRALLKLQIKPFMKEIVAIKGLLLSSHMSIVSFIEAEAEEERNHDEDTSNASSPYVSPQKKAKVKDRQ